MNRIIKILLLEDSPEDVQKLRRILGEIDSVQFELVPVEHLTEALPHLLRNRFDLILTDLSLPASQGLDTISNIASKITNIPIVVLTGAHDDMTGLEAVRRGAQDYLDKAQLNPSMLLRVIRYSIERKKLENVKEDFIGMVSHELRTPLAVIREGVSQVLDRICGPINDSQRQCLNLSLNHVDRLTRIISNLLDISRIEAGKLNLTQELHDVAVLAEEAIAFLSPIIKDKRLRIKVDFPKEREKINVDKDRIIQVFTNLIGNALKFTEKGHIQVIVVNRKEGIECSVADTGKGIDKEDVPKLFSKFQQFGRVVGPGEKGTGLGLSIVKGIVELHKGDISVESRVNKGTKFTFILPKGRTDL